jgi:polyisoprenyl-phosphate glycosyltransferase
MQKRKLFLSVVLAVRNSSLLLSTLLPKLCDVLTNSVSDFEIIVVENSSTDNTIEVLKSFTTQRGLPNIQVFALAHEVDTHLALWAGVENALGDYVAALDLNTDNPLHLEKLLADFDSNCDIGFCRNKEKAKENLAYSLFGSSFLWFYKKITGLHLKNEAPSFRILSKRVVNYILQHPNPPSSYRTMPLSSGFSQKLSEYSYVPSSRIRKGFWASVEKGVQLLVSTTRAPMRLVSALCIFGAFANIIYTFYVVLIALIKTNVAEGWVSLSLQSSGMFFLISLVLLVLSEYILNFAKLSSEGPAYYVAQEFNSVEFTRQKKLNVEDGK